MIGGHRRAPSVHQHRNVPFLDRRSNAASMAPQTLVPAMMTDAGPSKAKGAARSEASPWVGPAGMLSAPGRPV